MTDDLGMDDLIARLRTRAADPERRVDARPTRLQARLGSISLADLVAGLTQVRSDLDRAVDSSRAGRIDPEVHARAQAFESEMTTPVDADLRPPASLAAIEAAEAALGVRLPSALRRVYLEVADGAVGPGSGLLRIGAVVDAYRELREGAALPRGRAWPSGLLPAVDRDPGFDCVEAATGRVIGWDPEGLSERSNERSWVRSFSELAPSVEAWLGGWLDARSPRDLMAEMIADAQVRAARTARAQIAAMTPEQRAAMGLPAVGWERVVWGGLGWEEDETLS